MKLIALCFAIACMAHAESVITFNLDPTPENPRNSEGSFATLASGRIIFCYSHFYGGARDESPARIVRIHSDDQGRTWSPPVTVVENSGAANVMSVSLLRLASGKLAMFYCIKNSWIDCRPHMRVSSDDGETWTEPKLVQKAPGYFVMNNDRVIQTSKGRLIIPLGFHRSRGTDPSTNKSWDQRAIAMWIYSDDEGATWTESSSWWAIPVPSGSGLFPFPPKKRNPFVAALSTDGGKTWPKRKLIENDPDGLYHYTAIHFVGDAMLIGYCAGDSKVGALNRLRIRRISLDWLKQP